MKIDTCTSLRSIGLMVMLFGISSTGCMSSGGWKMPKMFSWNREPSATTLAGTTTPPLPESPANKYSPNAIASVGAGSSGPGTSSTNKAPTNGYAGQTSPTTKTASAGLAATANGYQTGPYQVGNTPVNSVQSASAYSGTTSSQPNAVAAGLPNPYGGSYGGTTGSSDIALPSNVKNSLASGPNYAATQNPYGSPSGSVPGVNSAANSGYTMTAGPAIPNALPGGTTNYPTPVANYSAPAISYPSLPNAGQISATAGGQGLPANIPLPSYPASTQTATVPPTSAYSSMEAPAIRNAGTYQPGTTARPTTYNFGASSASATSTTLPPNTASGAGPGIIPPTAPTTLYR